jgi:hypothetical protein
MCLDCLNRITGTANSPKKYIISKDFDLCEECGQMKPVIIRMRTLCILHEQFLTFSRKKR